MALPGSKSVTNRALVLGALGEGESLVHRPLRSRDTSLMVEGVRALGAAVRETGDGWAVTGRPLHGGAVEVGNAGTVARFLPPVAALASGSSRFTGDDRMRQRPLGPLLDALRALGADVEGRSIPFVVHGLGSVRGGAVALDASLSSQLVSGLLLSSPRYDRGIDLTHEGPPMPSPSHVAMTVALMRSFGATVDTGPDRWRVGPGGYASREFDVEPDLSGAAPFLAAAAATGGRVRIPGWPRETTQPGAALPRLLAAMGATATWDSGGLTVSGPDRLTGLEADLVDAGELLPVLAALAALARSSSRLTGVAHVRLQETDRLAALAAELRRLGAEVEERDDGLVIEPRPLRPAVFQTYDDHRLVMAAAVLALVVPGIAIANPVTVAKTMPDFADRWLAMLAMP